MPKALISKDNFKTALKTSAKKRSTKTEQDHYLVALKVSGGQITVGALYTCTRTHNASRNANTIEVKVGVRKGALSFYNFPPELVKPLVTRLKARAPQAKLATKYEHEGALDEKDPLQALIGAEWGEDEDDAKKKKGGKKKPVRRTSITLSDSEVEDSHPLYAGADDDDDAWMAAAVDNIGDPFAQMTLPRAPDLPPPPPPPEMSDDAMMDMIASAPSFGDEDDLMDAQQTPGEVVGGIEDWRAQNPRHQRAPSLQQGDDGASHPPPQRPTPGQFGDEVDFFNENPHLRPQPPQPQPSAPPDPTEATTPGWGDETHLQAEADPSAPSAPILDDEQLLDEQMWDDINSMIDTLPRERSRRPAPPNPLLQRQDSTTVEADVAPSAPPQGQEPETLFSATQALGQDFRVQQRMASLYRDYLRDNVSRVVFDLYSEGDLVAQGKQFAEGCFASLKQRRDYPQLVEAPDQLRDACMALAARWYASARSRAQTNA